ncbi:cupin domain-containing protein [Rhodococcus sp. NPDC056960]|uniref:cupin domain-containing protein n=1 Tax=Rhodococcus sp. NPDC056960 TaxID=3345982 RepID=UPI0036286636
MTDSALVTDNLLQKYSLAVFDTLEWELMEELPDCCTRNGDSTMKFSLMAGDGFSAGTLAAWSCDRDGFTSENIPVAEAAFILEGVVRLTDAKTGEVTIVNTGEGYRLPAGWSGRWEALEPVRKIYILF